MQLWFFLLHKDEKKLLRKNPKQFSVRLKGLEPPRLSAPDPKSGAATNYATAALWCFASAKILHFFDLPNEKCTDR